METDSPPIMSRTVIKSLSTPWREEGTGSRLKTLFEGAEPINLDPFLKFEEFILEASANIPDHPHRGYETVTLTLDGSFTCEDFSGSVSVSNPGDLEWVTAGRGLVHAKRCVGNKAGHGIQIWVNLRSEHKMIKPQSQGLSPRDTPCVVENGVIVKVLAGECAGKRSRIYTRTPTLFLDFTLDPGASFSQPIPVQWTCFIYVLEGTVYLGPCGHQHEGEKHSLMILSEGDHVQMENQAEEKTRFVLIAGKPLKEPICQFGQFVMNTEKEIHEAISDFYYGRNGFEKADSWKSCFTHERTC